MGIGRAVGSLYLAEWGSPQLGHFTREISQQASTGRRLPPLGHTGLGHLCAALVWWRLQNGHVGCGWVHLMATWPNLQQLSHWEKRLAGTIGVTHLGLEKRRTEELIVSTSCGMTVMATDMASLPSREVGSGLRYLADRMLTPLAFLTQVATLSKSASGSSGRYKIGREWIARWDSLGASLKGSHGELPTGKD